MSKRKEIERHGQGLLNSEVDEGGFLSADRRHKVKHEAKAGQGDHGDRLAP